MGASAICLPPAETCTGWESIMEKNGNLSWEQKKMGGVGERIRLLALKPAPSSSAAHYSASQHISVHQRALEKTREDEKGPACTESSLRAASIFGHTLHFSSTYIFIQCRLLRLIRILRNICSATHCTFPVNIFSAGCLDLLEYFEIYLPWHTALF